VLWKNLRDKGRNMVRAGRRKGVTTRIANEIQYFDLFYAMYKAVRTRLNTQYIGYKELRAKFDAFTAQGLADFWVAFLDDVPLAYNFMWTYNHHVNYVYNSSHPEYLKYNPNNVLQWDMICYYKERGYTLYNMWGVRNMNLSEKDALRPDRDIEGYGRFKLSIGAELRDLVRYVRL
jgi:lipid II:glycine glycyltransferase (peptidoglycan interpeptide bridge formation enzyme)